jgi:hypothetical protein
MLTFTISLGSLVLETYGSTGVKTVRAVSIVVKAVWVKSARGESRSAGVGCHGSTAGRVDSVDRVRVVWLIKDQL